MSNDEARGRRRFRRPGPDDAADLGEPLAALRAEVLLLREENVRLRSVQHQAADIGRLLDRARSVHGARHNGHHDESAQLLVDGLVMRESLLEICREIERSMVAFEAKLDALAASPVVAEADHPPEQLNGNGSLDA